MIKFRGSIAALSALLAVSSLGGAAPLAAQQQVPVSAPAPASAAVAGTTLSIDELYRYKSLVGIDPQGYSWSADGSAVLFLWNDEGYAFRDVWSYTPKTGKRVRLTFLGKDSKP